MSSKAEAVIHAVTRCSREIELIRGRTEKVVEKCRLSRKWSSRRIAEEVGDPDPDRRWTQENFTLESIKVGEPRKLLANRQPGRRSQSNLPIGPPHQLRILKNSVRDPNVPSWAQGFYAAVQAFLADTALATPSGFGTAVSSEATPGTETQYQSDALSTDAHTDRVTV
uniref:Integrase core domain containing protein n=1 Tax=Solanum tuberosum TaxID=4113 RepID=M1DKT7_SOLTU